MLRLFLFVALLLHLTAGQPGAFRQPSPGKLDHDYSKSKIFAIGDYMPVQWETEDADRVFGLVLWQEQTHKYEFISNALKGNGDYIWKVTTDLSLTNAHAFFFQMVDMNNHTTNSPANYFVSTYFNITEGSSQTDSTTTITSTGSTMTKTISLTRVSGASTAPTASLTTFTGASFTANISAPTSLYPSYDNGGLSPEARLGIGLGVGLGATFLICMAVIIWYIRRRLERIAPASNMPPPWTPMTQTQAPVPAQGATAQYPKPGSPVEVPGSKPRTPVEAPSDPRTESRLQRERFELES